MSDASKLTQVDTIKKGYTLEELRAALIRNDGRVYITAKELGITAQAIYKRMEENPELKDVISDARGELLDIAESALKQKLKDGDTAAIIFVAKTLGKDRGYTERQELTGKDGNALNIFVKRGNDGSDNG